MKTRREYRERKRLQGEDGWATFIRTISSAVVAREQLRMELWCRRWRRAQLAPRGSMRKQERWNAKCDREELGL